MPDLLEARPVASEHAAYFSRYVDLVADGNIVGTLAAQLDRTLAHLKTISDEDSLKRYADGKWTLKELLQHIIDAERIFSYRALRFARKDPTPLPGFDENLFAANAKADERSWDKLVEELKVVRRSSELLFHSLDKEQLEAAGTSSNSPNYVLAIGYIIIGHAMHHQKIIRERYL